MTESVPRLSHVKSPNRVHPEKRKSQADNKNSQLNEQEGKSTIANPYRKRVKASDKKDVARQSIITNPHTISNPTKRHSYPESKTELKSGQRSTSQHRQEKSSIINPYAKVKPPRREKSCSLESRTKQQEPTSNDVNKNQRSILNNTQIQIIPDSPPVKGLGRSSRDDLHEEVIKFTTLVNNIVGSNHHPPNPLCPFCVLTKAIPIEKREDCWYQFGTSSRCQQNCYGCGIQFGGCEHHCDENKCREQLYTSRLLNEEISTITEMNLPVVCKCCLRPANSEEECVSYIKCWSSPNKYFVWRFCHVVRRILYFELEMPNWEGINSFPNPVLLMIKQAVVKMGEDFIGHRNDLGSMGMDRWIPSSCIGDAREWSDWLLSADMGDFFNYMVLFRYCFNAVSNNHHH